MIEEIIAVFCICSDFLKQKGVEDDPRAKMNNAEVMLVQLVATRFYYGNMERARQFLMAQGYVKRMLSKSQLNRRLHQTSTELWEELIEYAYLCRESMSITHQLIADSFPLAVCHNIRIRRCRLFQGEAFRGYCVSKKQYFYGVKVTVLTTTEGQPVQAILCPGREHDSVPFKYLCFDKIRPGTVIYADSAYTDSGHEQKLLDMGIKLVAARRSNSTKPIDLEDFVGLKAHRQSIERAFSKLTSWMPKAIHAVTPEGFELKIWGFLAALALHTLITI